MTSELLADSRSDDANDSRERSAARLLSASAKTSYDPVVHIDWDAPLPADRYYTPPQRSSLYGTELWDGLSEQQRIELTKHELASIAGTGVWFETILMKMLVRHAYHRDPTTAHVQYAYTEVGDECRHSVMFGKLVDRLGTPYYRPHWLVHWLGAFYGSMANGPLTFGGALFVEEILDQFQREAMADESLQPLVRAVSRVHVVEEARHMRYAREENARSWSDLGFLERAWTRFWLGGVAYFTATCVVNPRVYRAVGLDARKAWKTAEHNPHWRESRRWAARKAVATLDEAGLIKWPGRWWWKLAGLVD